MPSISDLSKARIVVVGDAMVDVWVHGRVDRISPEAPVPVFVEERREERPGGASNVVENLRALHCKVRDFGTSGPIKTRFLVNNQQIGLRHDKEDCSPISAEIEAFVFNNVSQVECDVLIISDYAKGVCTPSLCQRLIQWGKARDIFIIVDPKGTDWRKYDGCDLLTPNEKEWSEVIKASVPRANLVITRGSAGMEVRLQGCPRYSIAATNGGPVDITGAGDTVVAVLAAASGAGWGLRAAIEMANAAAGVVVGKFGTATCTIEELEEAWSRVSRTVASTVCTMATATSSGNA
jgi:D-beta-D-heptose 7-phosphate kinase/D-beta-D-heptose 1-phosphate adenosyltransferase